jgi:AAA domain
MSGLRLVWGGDDFEEVDKLLPTDAVLPTAVLDDNGRALTERELRHLPPIEWEHVGLTQRGYKAFLVGPRGCHKSRALVALLGASVTGGAVYGAQATRSGPVYAVIAEDVPGWRERWFAWRRAYGVADDVDLELYTRTEPVNLFTGAGFEDLLAEIATVDPVVIGLDTFADLTTGMEENSAKDMGIVRERLKRLTLGGRTVIATHHTGYNEGRERGSSAFGGMADTIVLMAAARDSGVTLTCEKQRNGVPFTPVSLVFDVEALVLRSTDGGISHWDAETDAALVAITTLLTGTPGLSGRGIEEHEDLNRYSRPSIRSACVAGVRRGLLRTEAGPKRAVLHWLAT